MIPDSQDGTLSQFQDREVKVCAECGVQFAKHPKSSRAQWQNARFCSWACGGKQRARKPLKDRFEAKFTRGPDDACWLWQAAKLTGYGIIQRGGRGSAIMAHRVSYELYVGPIPAGLDLDHLCRNRACVNPAHLEPVTRAENIRRGTVAKLTMEAARQIREAEGTHTEIAARFGVSPRNIGTVRQGLTWK